MTIQKIFAAFGIALLIGGAPAVTDAKNQNQGQRQGQGQGQGQGHGQGRGNDNQFDNRGNQGNQGNQGRATRGHAPGVIRDYYGNRRHPCARRLPPGIRRQVAAGRPIPPGLRRNRCRLPDDLVSRLPYGPGYHYYVVGDGVARVNVSTGIIVDIWFGLF